MTTEQPCKRLSLVQRCYERRCYERRSLVQKCLIYFLILLAVGAGTRAQTESFQWFPNGTYDTAIPTPRAVLGHSIGEYYSEHLQMIEYMRLLEKASPRVKVFSVGRSYEKREILLVAVSTPENIRTLEEIRLAIAELRDPRVTSQARALAIAESVPAIAWMNFANDGNESAALETAIQLAYQLAAGEDGSTQQILEETVTLIYPTHNPESHSRHVAWMKASAMGNPNPDAQEHRGDWRMDNNNNHYQIDLNRDAAFLTQVESQIIARELHRWNPVVFVDHHGNPDRYFFPPWARPVNNQVGEKSHHWVQILGRSIAKAFDRNGWTYFTRNVFDLHYPGYWDSYPTLNGATGMTFETDGGGNKGLAYRLPDNRITTLRDGIQHHFIAAMATLESTASNRQQRLLDLYDFRATALSEAEQDKLQQFVIEPSSNPERTIDLVNLLLKHSIEVYRTDEPFRSSLVHGYLSQDVGTREFQPGAFVIPGRQPQKRLLRALMDRESPLDEVFLEEVKASQAYNDGVGATAPKKRLGFYDITAWSLPLAFGVEAYWTEDPFDGRKSSVSEPLQLSFAFPEKRAGFAYLFHWDSRAATRLVARLWEEEYQVSVAREGFVLGGQTYPPGTVVLRIQPNPESLHERLRELASANPVKIHSVDTAMVDSGKDLGDPSVVDLKQPSIAVVTEEPVRQTAFGALWFLLERDYQVPFTAIKTSDLMSVELKKYNVIVLPDGPSEGYTRVFDTKAVERFKRWVNEGGTLICIKGATVWASGSKVGLTTATVRRTEGPGQTAEEPKEDEEPEEGSSPDGKKLPPVPGALVQVHLDDQHFLSLGMPKTITPLLRSDFVFTPTKKGALVARLDENRPLLAGFAFELSQEILKGTSFLWDEPMGRGHVICFADDVTFRIFLMGSHRLLLNSMLLAPSGKW